MKKRTLLAVLSLVLIVFILLTGCGQNESGPTDSNDSSGTSGQTGDAEQSGPKAEFKVGYICADLENPAWNAISEGFLDKAKELGMTANSVSSTGQASTQFKHIQDMITQEYDAVVLSGTDSSSANAAIKALNEANIPVWCLHIEPDDPNVEYQGVVTADNLDACYQAGKYLSELAKDKGLTGVAAEISISLARSNGKDRHEGFMKAMNEAGIEVVSTKEAITYTRDEGYQFTQDLITSTPDLMMVWGNFDEASLGAMKAIEDAGKLGQILVGTLDGSPDSLKALLDGRMNVVAIQPLYIHGNTVAEQMYGHLANGAPGESVFTPCPLVKEGSSADEVQDALHDTFGPEAKLPE